MGLFEAELVSGHHSSIAFDLEKSVNFEGIITKYIFKNPHVYINIERKNIDGTKFETEVEAGAASVIGPLGFEKNALHVGDSVRVVGNPSRKNPERLILGKELYKKDGSYLPLNISSKSDRKKSEASTNTIDGTWFAPKASFFGILAEIKNWPLTEQGLSYVEEMYNKPTPQKDCIPLGEPALLAYPVATIITIKEDRVEIFIDWLDSHRTIWTDNRSHPKEDLFQHGYSTGHFEGNTLIAKSSNFTFNPIGFSTFLASSDRKQLSEKFELSPDGKKLIYSGIAKDEIYLTNEVSFSIELEHSPEISVSNEPCDREIGYRFLDD